jgi:hypothetical protein
MAMFRFCPELFEERNRVMEALAAEGYSWLSHFSSVDPLHDTYGIEVCGIRDRDDALAIQKLLKKLYPQWLCG